MSWASEPSGRKDRLPANWDSLRKEVETRAGGRCEAIQRNGKRCHDPGNQCDHIVPGDDHSPSNLQWLCEWHHARKSSAEGHAAQAARRNKRFHPQPPHPGSLPPKEASDANPDQAKRRQNKPVSAFEWRPPERADAGCEDPGGE